MSILSDWIDLNFSTVAAPAGAAPAASAPMASTLDVEEAAWAKLAALREGRRNVVYYDSLHKPTGGIGHLILPDDGLSVGDHIDDATIEAWWKRDGEDAFSHAIALDAVAGIKDLHFLPYLASVCYQLGDLWTKKFPLTWQMICRGEYEKAAQALEGTAWDNQTPSRVADLQGALRRLPDKA